MSINETELGRKVTLVRAAHEHGELLQVVYHTTYDAVVLACGNSLGDCHTTPVAGSHLREFLAVPLAGEEKHSLEIRFVPSDHVMCFKRGFPHHGEVWVSSREDEASKDDEDENNENYKNRRKLLVSVDEAWLNEILAP